MITQGRGSAPPGPSPGVGRSACQSLRRRHNQGGRQALRHPVADLPDQPLRAIVLVLVAMFLFVSMNGVAKFLTDRLPTEQIIWARYGFVLLALLPALWRERWHRPFATSRRLHHIARGLCLLASALIFMRALHLLPIETVTAIGFVSPLFVTALSIPLLGERVGPRRWAAVGIGFVGVLVILRPAGGDFQAAMLLPILSAFLWAVALIITRWMRGSEQPFTILLYSSLVGWIVLAAYALPTWKAPEIFEWALLAVIGIFQALAQYLVIRAFMLGSASLLAPFSYGSILWAGVIGAVFFQTLPDGATAAGTLILIGAGLYVWHRERATATPATVPGASIAEAGEAKGDS